MSWFKVDDHFWSHPKTADLSDGATSLWLRAGSWSAGHLTDGRVPVSMLRMFRARRRSADELITAGLWSIDGDTFVFHSWHEYQPSKAQVEAKREATRDRVNAWRERQGNAVTNASQNEDGNAAPGPARPDPTLSTSDEVESAPRKRAATAKGTRIPEPFMLTAEMRAEMAADCPGLDIDLATKQFVDYWRAASGRTATKKDWVAAWRFWMRRDAEKGTGRPTPTARAIQTASEGRAVAGRVITTLEPKEIAS
jgi:hypothetical protein